MSAIGGSFFFFPSLFRSLLCHWYLEMLGRRLPRSNTRPGFSNGRTTSILERVSQRRLAASFSYRTIPCFSAMVVCSARKMIPCLRRSVPSLLLVQTDDLGPAAGLFVRVGTAFASMSRGSETAHWDFFISVLVCLFVCFRNTRSPGSTIP